MFPQSSQHLLPVVRSSAQGIDSTWNEGKERINTVLLGPIHKYQTICDKCILAHLHEGEAPNLS